MRAYRAPALAFCLLLLTPAVSSCEGADSSSTDEDEVEVDTKDKGKRGKEGRDDEGDEKKEKGGEGDHDEGNAAEDAADEAGEGYAAPPALAADKCRLDGEPAEIGADDKKLMTELAAGPAGGMLVHSLDAGTIRATPLDVDGRPAGASRDVNIPGAKGLIHLAALGERFVVVTHEMCPGTKRSHKCLNALALDATGAAIGEVDTEDVREWITAYWHNTDDALLLGAQQTYEAPRFRRYSVDDAGVHREDLPDLVARDSFDPGLDFRFYSVRADGERSLALFSTYDEDKDRHEHELLIHPGDERVAIRGLPNSYKLRVADMSVMDDGYAFLFDVDGGPVQFLRVGTNGKPVEKAGKVAKAEPLPAPFEAAPWQAHVEKSKKRHYFEARTLAGEPAGEPIDLGDGPAEGKGFFRLARARNGYVAAWTEVSTRSRPILLIRIRCVE